MTTKKHDDAFSAPVERDVMPSVYDFVAWHEGSLGTKWGPCLDGAKFQCDCIACKNANYIESIGLDFYEEYKKAKCNDFIDP